MPDVRRRELLGGTTALAFPWPSAPRQRALTLLAAPLNLGLRPPRPDVEPGAWEAPSVLIAAGLAEAVGADDTVTLPRPAYSPARQPGTRILNGPALRAFSERLGDEVGAILNAGRFPLVIGGDCAVLLGCLLGARAAGEVGLVHIDGHSDFFHPGNYDERELRTAAGMDLALATGRGEPLLSDWNGRPLVRDEHAVQVGEREEGDLDYPFHDLFQTRISTFPIRAVLDRGVDAIAAEVLDVASLPHKLWVHIDLDVIDQAVMPAVDSPGSPGLGFDQLATLLGALLASGRTVGADVTIYDPSMDAGYRLALPIVECLGKAFGQRS